MEALRFALLGLASGAIYLLLAVGLVLVYRGSGVLNFAQGAMAMVGAYVYYEVSVEDGLPQVLGLVAGVLASATAGALVHLLVLRPMRTASPLARVIATLGVLVVLQSSAFLLYGHDPLALPSVLDTSTVTLGSKKLAIGADRIEIFVIGVVLTAVLFWVYRRTPFGRLTTAVAEDQLVVASLGHSPDLIATINWALGSGLAGLAGVLIAPIIFLEPSQLVLLVLPAMAAALVGGFRSFVLAAAAALTLGVAQSEMQRYVSQPGWASAAPFLVVIALLAVRGTSLPGRSFVLDRLPTAGDGRFRPALLAVAYVVVGALILGSDPDWAAATTTTVALGIICLSVVVVTGYAGQLSLAQSVLAGLGALVAAQVAGDVPFPVALVVGALVAGVVGTVVGLPALRTRGLTLAIATLGLGSAIGDVVLSNTDYTGGVSGLSVPVPSVAGWSIDPFLHGGRYAFVTFTVFTVVAVALMNLRRGAIGRQLLAVRSNERAAAATGVNVSVIKTYAFTAGAVIAGLGGVLLAFVQPSVEVGSAPGFTVFACILVVAVTVAGSVGSVGGAVIGALLLAGGVTSQLLKDWTEVNDYLPLIGGVILVLVLVAGPDGLFVLNARLLAPVLRRLDRLPGLRRLAVDPAVGASAPRRASAGLTVTGLTVTFGGVRALRGVDLDVRPGEIHALIGPNGAGKTTLVDAVTGFVRSEGQVHLGDVDVSRWRPRRLARAGFSRSFQSLELFEDLTIAENLAIASESPGPLRFLVDFVAPQRPVLSPAAQTAAEEFELSALLGQRPSNVSFGQRKTVAIARALAADPCVLLLDEPAAGLDDHEAAELASLVRRLASERQIAVLLIEHNLDVVMQISDRVTVLQQGAVLSSGTPSEIRRDQAVVDAYLG